METAPRTGKSWQTSHEPPHRRETCTCHTDNTEEREEGKGALKKCSYTQGMLTIFTSTQCTCTMLNPLQSESTWTPEVYAYLAKQSGLQIKGMLVL